MRVRGITLREIHLKLKVPFETSMDRAELRRILLLEVETDGAVGWGECVAGEKPYYSPETLETAWIVLREFLWPRIKGRELAAADEVWGLLAQVRGHNMAKAALEAALWDAEARRKAVSLATLISGSRREIACGVSIGIKSTLDELVAAVRTELAAGYQRIKIKIRPGWDLEPVRRLRQEFPRIRLMVDANSAYRLDDWAMLKQLEGFYLMMIEQPLGWDDIYSHAQLQAKLETPVCLDECIHSFEHARAAIELRACKIINIKLGRVGGYAQAIRIHDLCREHGIPVWCGGMLESGIGRAHNIALATLPNFTLPGDVSASKRYWTRDIIQPPVETTAHGTIAVRDQPGFGYDLDREFLDTITVRRHTVS